MRGSQNTSTDKIVLKAILEDNNKEMFLKLKEKYNLKYNIEVFHFILRKIYEEEFKDTE